MTNRSQLRKVRHKKRTVSSDLDAERATHKSKGKARIDQEMLTLIDAGALYKSIVEHMWDVVMLTQPDGRIYYLSPACKTVLGHDQEDLVGRQPWIVHQDDLAKVKELHYRALKGEPGSNVEYRIKTKTGETKWVLHSWSPLFVEEKLKLIVSILRDVTDQKRTAEETRQYSRQLEEMVKERTQELTKSEEKYRRIYEASVNAIYTTSIDGTIIDMNQAGISMFGFDNLDEMKKVNITELYADPEDRKRLIELALKGRVRGFEVQLKKKDGRLIDAFVNTYALTDDEGNIIGFQGAITDITERKELERMRDQLTSTILTDVTKRRELERMKDQFISSVTHELRTPLISVKGYVDDVLTGEVGGMSKEVASSLIVVKRNTERLLGLVDELLEIRRLESGRLQLDLSPLDFLEVVHHCTEEAKPLVDGKRQSFHVETPEKPLMIQGDRARLIQVVMNLLNNASKFTPEGGDVKLRVEEQEESIQIQVSDTGMGIGKEDLERIFEPFAAIEKPTYVKGTGLGLSVTRGLVEAHGGRIWAESLGEGKGATFTVILPKKGERGEI